MRFLILPFVFKFANIYAESEVSEMARMLNRYEAAERRRQQEVERKAQKEREDAFIAEWVGMCPNLPVELAEEQARFLLKQLDGKADKQHGHGHGLIG